MNCPNCKNPVQANNPACELCGTQLKDIENNEVIPNANINLTNRANIPLGRKTILFILPIFFFLFVYIVIRIPYY